MRGSLKDMAGAPETIRHVSDEILVVRCGTVPYAEAWDAAARAGRAAPARARSPTCCCCSSTRRSTRAAAAPRRGAADGGDWYEAQGIEVLDTDRGGLVTYHGPGQLVAYPIVDLAPLGDDVHAYVRGLERVMIGALAEHGVGAQTIEGLTGVWTDGPAPGPGLPGAARKIGSIGVHVSRGVTTHGLAVNVNNDLQPFEWVVPCGIEGVAMTSLARELGARAGPRRLRATRSARHFAEVFEREPRASSRPSAAELRAWTDRDRPATLGGER